MQWRGVIKDKTLTQKDIASILPIVFYLEGANQLSLLPYKDLVDLCSPIESYQVTKSQIIRQTLLSSNHFANFRIENRMAIAIGRLNNTGTQSQIRTSKPDSFFDTMVIILNG